MQTITKKQQRINDLNGHYKALENIAEICGVVNPNGKKLSLQLWKLEKQAYKIILDYSSDSNFVGDWEELVKPILESVQKLFNNNLKGLYANGDPRGSALKINDKEFNGYYFHTGLTRDWGGNGMLSPDFDN